MNHDDDLQLPQKTLDTLASLSYRNGELQIFLDQACQSVIDLLGDGLAAITLYQNSQKHVLALMPESEKGETQFETHGHLSTYVVDSKATLVVPDALANSEYGEAPAGYCSYLGIPLKMPSGEVVGTLCYFDREKRPFNNNERCTAELFAQRIAIALDNYQLYQKLKDHSTSLEQLVTQRTNELLAARDELAHKEKLAAVGRFASQITHEIRNPLATIRMALEYIQKQQDLSSGLQKRAALAACETSRLELLLTEVLHYATPQKVHPHALDINAYMDDFILSYESLVASKQCQFKRDDRDTNLAPIFALADRNKLTQVCLNLTTNACHAAHEDGDITWSVGMQNERCFIRIHNWGETIPEGKLHQITEAFVSGRPGGFGLGLAIVKSIIDEHQGQITIESNAESGTTVTLYLPMTTPCNEPNE